MPDYKILNRCFYVSINGIYFCQRNVLVIEDVSNNFIEETINDYRLIDWDEFVKVVNTEIPTFEVKRRFNDEVIYDNDLPIDRMRKSNFECGKTIIRYTEPEYDISISDIIKRFDHKKALAYLLQEINKLKENNDE